MASNKVTKFVIRNNIGSILYTCDSDEEAKDFYKKHVMASYVEKVTITSEVIEKKLKKKDEIDFKLTNWFWEE